MCASDLAGLLQDLVGLEWLDLGNNRITAEGIKALAAEFKTSKQLKFLGLAQNPFEKEGLPHFMEIVQNVVLQKWQLSSTMFSLEEIVRFFAATPGLDYFCGSWTRRYSTPMVVANLLPLAFAVPTAKAEPASSSASVVEAKQPHDTTPSTKTHWKLWKRAKPPVPREKEISRSIDKDLKKENTASDFIRGLIIGTGNSRLALFRELASTHEPIPEQKLHQETQERLLKYAKKLAPAVPHYGSRMLCPSSLDNLCRAVIGASESDETTTTLIEEFWRQDEAGRALVAAQLGRFVFPRQIVPFLDRFSKSNFVPTTRDILDWNEQEHAVRNYHVLWNDVPIWLVDGGAKLLNVFEGEGVAVIIAGSYAEMKDTTIPYSKFASVITYSNPCWTEEELRTLEGVDDVKRTYSTSTFGELGTAIKDTAITTSLAAVGLI